MDEVRAVVPSFFEILAVGINLAEAFHALKEWESPGGDTRRVLKDNCFPGDIGFDLFGLKPDNTEDFAAVSTKLQNGRLAICLQYHNRVYCTRTVSAGLVSNDSDPSSLPVQF